MARTEPDDHFPPFLAVMLRSLSSFAIRCVLFPSRQSENIEEVLKQENSPTKDVDGKLEELQKQLLQKANRNEQYDDLVEEIYKLREEKQQILADKAEMEGVKQSIFNMKAFLNSQTAEIEEYDEQLVRRLIAKVTVFDDKFEVELKSGLSVDIRRSK